MAFPLASARRVVVVSGRALGALSAAEVVEARALAVHRVADDVVGAVGRAVARLAVGVVEPAGVAPAGQNDSSKIIVHSAVLIVNTAPVASLAVVALLAHANSRVLGANLDLGANDVALAI